jgi:hypothetical protein
VKNIRFIDDPAELVGKEIATAALVQGYSLFMLGFTDGTALTVRHDIDEELELVPQASSLTPYGLMQAGLITEEEYEEVEKQRRLEWSRNTEIVEREQLARLKAKYEP